MRLAYLAEPIDQRVDSNALDLVAGHISAMLHQHGFDVYRPRTAFLGGGPCSAAIQIANNSVLDNSTIGVVLLPAGVPTLGTPIEVDRFLRNRTPVLVITDLERSVQLASWIDRGAVVCPPDAGAETLATILGSMREDDDRPGLSSSLNSLSATLRRTRLISRPLVFEPVGDETILTPSGPVHLLPTRGYPDDAGLDLYVSRNTTIEARGFADVPSGVKIDIPAGHWAMITGRSSTLRSRGLLVSTGVIDAGWTGELFAGVQNLTDLAVGLQAGDRLAQLILLPAPVVGLEPEWGRVPVKARGENGFGSTGS